MEPFNMTVAQTPELVHPFGHVGPTIFLASLLKLVLTAIVFWALHFIHKDYKAFLALGPGGTPCTILGYLRITVLRLFALRNPYLPDPVPIWMSFPLGYVKHSSIFLKQPTFPRRRGLRPSVTGIAPHRQTNQKGDATMFAALTAAILQLADLHPSRLRLGTSCFEKHGTGLFSRYTVNRTCNGEICHAHASDGSLHMTLHPADAKMVLENGWGERHPLAKGGWLTRFVPRGFVMIYAPRNDEELRMVLEIVKAAAWWVSGESLDSPRVPPKNSQLTQMASTCEWNVSKMVRHA